MLICFSARHYLNGYRSIRVNRVHDHLEYVSPSVLADHKPDSYNARDPKYYYAKLNGLTQSATNPIPIANSLKTKMQGGRTFLLGQKFSDEFELILSQEQWEENNQPGGYIKGLLHVLGIDGRKQRVVPGSKRHELFLPIPPQPRRIAVSDEAVDRFVTLGAERDDVGAPPFELKGNSDWRPRAGDLVYFDVELDGNEPYVSEFSISAIWRGRVEETINDNGRRVRRAAGVYRFFETISGELLPFNKNRTHISPAELMFGFTSGDRKENEQDVNWLAYRGRVRPGFGICVEKPKRLSEVTLKILDSPKLPSPNLYFQVGANGITKAALTLTHKPQGRKMYLHQRIAQGSQPWKTMKQEGASQTSFKQHVRIKPLDTGFEFVFHLDFDNLTEWELGVLCFALRPGEKFRHKLGMGKPLGLGSVRIDPAGLFLIDRVQRYTHDGPRYQQVWRSENTNVQNWPDLYDVERNLSVTSDAPTPADFRNRFRAEVNTDVLCSLDLLGNPEFVKAKVHYPLAERQNNPEDELFKWFVNNEKWAIRDQNPEPGDGIRAQRLEPLNQNSTELPTLDRNSEPQPRQNRNNPANANRRSDGRPRRPGNRNEPRR